MAQQVIAPIIPNLSMQESAVAGSSAAIFTSTDRKIIKERAGEIDHTKSFKEIFAEKRIIPKVENEETTVKPEVDIRELEEREREHFKMLKDSPVKIAHERVGIGKIEPDPSIVPADMVKEPPVPPAVSQEKAEIGSHTEKIIKELNLNPDEVVSSFEVSDNDFHQLIYRIKELHLRRVLVNTMEEFEALSVIIKRETLAAVKPESKDWMIEQLNILKKGSAEYKLKLLNSLKTMGLNSEQEKNIAWLEKIVKG